MLLPARDRYDRAQGPTTYGLIGSPLLIFARYLGRPANGRFAHAYRLTGYGIRLGFYVLNLLI